MSWLTDTNGTTLPVSTLLGQIALLIDQCEARLAGITPHATRCSLNQPTDDCHSELNAHGPDGAPIRPTRYAELLSVRTRLTKIRADLDLCSTEMSHGGMV